MKALVTILLVLGITSSLFATDNVPTKRKNIEGLAMKIIESFNYYKQRDENSCKALMKQMGFSLSKEEVNDVPKTSLVASLVYDNSSDSKWAYYKMVDLDYIRDVEATISFKHSDSQLIFEALKELLSNTHHLEYEGDMMGMKTIKFVDHEGAVVIDDRFQQESASKEASLYQYQISTDGEYVFIDLKETVPRKVFVANEIELLAANEE
ncbi:hypothetical protein [Ekhidna sp.]|uniref:hypothetical protein n=1 Tax=Ekhidna sp. TaxID=2608089 RepID=UPI0035123E96